MSYIPFKEEIKQRKPWRVILRDKDVSSTIKNELPYNVEESAISYIGIKSNGRLVAKVDKKVYSNQKHYENDRARAEFIVNACNNYHDLIDVLKIAFEDMMCSQLHEDELHHEISLGNEAAVVTLKTLKLLEKTGEI